MICGPWKWDSWSAKKNGQQQAPPMRTAGAWMAHLSRTVGTGVTIWNTTKPSGKEIATPSGNKVLMSETDKTDVAEAKLKANDSPTIMSE